MKENDQGSKFLNLIYKDLKDQISNKKENITPVEKISLYLEKLDKIHKEAISDEHKKELLKYFYYEKYIIKSLPLNYVKYSKGYIKKLGFSENLTDEQKQIVLEKIQLDQKQSLSNWIDYLCDEFLDYPIWFKYYVFNGMIKIGNFYSTLLEFTKRSKSTTSNFLDIDHDVISKMYEVLNKKINEEELSEQEQLLLSKGSDFKNLYLSIYYYKPKAIKKNDFDTKPNCRISIK